MAYSTFISSVLWIYVVLVITFKKGMIGAMKSHERRLYDALLEDYNSELRPLLNASRTVTVKLKFELTKINNVDEVNQQMHVVGFYIAEWSDEYLVWNSSDYGGIKRLIIPASRIWVPDFVIVNSADRFYHEEFQHDFRVLIRHDGKVTWSFGGNIIVSCEMDMTRFPFDEQKCYMKIENWQYDKSEVNLVNSTAEIEKDEFHTNGMWKVMKTTSSSSIIYHQAFPGVSYPTVMFEIFLHRRPGYYMLSIFVPCLLLALLALLVFWLPPDSGEKIGLGITIILAFGVFALIVADKTPRTSSSYPILSIWMCILITVSSLNTFVTIAVLHCHHHLPTRPYSILRIAFLEIIGPCLCVSGIPARRTSKNAVNVGLNSDITQATNRNEYVGHNNNASIDVGVRSSPTANNSSINTGPHGSPLVRNHRENSQQHELVTVVKDVLQHLKVIARSIRNNETDSDKVTEWMAIARVIDRLCFWINLIIIVVSTVLCFTFRKGFFKPEI